MRSWLKSCMGSAMSLGGDIGMRLLRGAWLSWGMDLRTRKRTGRRNQGS